MTEIEKEILRDCLTECVSTTTNIVYETLAMLFKTVAETNIKQGRQMTAEQVLLVLSEGLKYLYDPTKKDGEKTDVK